MLQSVYIVLKIRAAIDFVYTLNGTHLDIVSEQKDLGVLISNDLLPRKHILDITKKANQRIGMIRCFSNITKEKISTLFTTTIRPLLEYASVVWQPHLKKDIDLLQKVQDRCLALCPNSPVLESLEQRRKQTDLIETYEILYQNYKCEPDNFFSLPNRALRGHSLKLHKVSSRTDVRKFFFSNRVINPWNTLDEEMVNAPSGKSFNPFPHGTISRSLLKSVSGEFDLESIHTVTLKHYELLDLGFIGECTCLERLDVSFNCFSKLHKLAGLENLQYLNLAANRISSLEGLQSLTGLEKLNLAGNLIGGVDSLRCLTACDKLVSLRLRDSTNGLSNPVCMNSSYTTDVVRMFPNLVSLDGERVKGPGSDVFKMMRDMDQALAERGSFNEETSSLTKTEWVPSDFWDPPRKFERSMLGDAQQQLEDLLASCKRLSSHADFKLEKLKSKT